MRPLYCFKRANGYYYIQFVNVQTGKKCTQISTHRMNRDQAVVIGYKWLENGIPAKNTTRPVSSVIDLSEIIGRLNQIDLQASDVGRLVSLLESKGHYITRGTQQKNPEKGIPLIPYLKAFWEFDHSDYVKHQIAHKKKIGKRHCYEMTNRVNKYWNDKFESYTIEQLTASELESFFDDLVNEEGLSGATVNKIMHAGSKALKWAKNKDQILYNPMEKIERFGFETKERGILEESEAKKLFQGTWSDEAARVANLTAMTCGLRAGEILGLRVLDIEADTLHVYHSWSPVDGLKCVKNTYSRHVPLLDEIRAELRKYAATNPAGIGPTSYVFYSTVSPDRPMDIGRLTDGLKGFECVGDSDHGGAAYQG